MAEGVAAVLVPAALRGREHEGAVLDRARTHEDVPMRLAGLLGERGRDRDEGRAGLRQRPVERWKAQVVANREPESTPRQVGDNGSVAGAEVTRFAVALAAREIDIEHVDLVVARGDLALWIDQERAIDRALGRNLQRERADV